MITGKKFFIILVLISTVLFIFTELRDFNSFTEVQYRQITNTGIDYNAVSILTKDVFILNPSKINYNGQADKIAFELKNPRYMKTAGYWISKLKNPDKIILDSRQINKLNEKFFKQKNSGMIRVEKYPQTVSRSSLIKIFKSRLSWYKNKKYFNEKAELITPDFWTNLYDAIDTGAKEIIQVKYALATEYCDVRIFPSYEKVLSGTSSKDIDRFQEESLDMGTPVAVLCRTKDKAWSYVMAPTEEGWVETKNISFTNKATLIDWVNKQNIVVVINSKADIFADAQRTKFVDYVRMGTTFPYYEEKIKKSYAIKIPTRGKNGNLIFKKAFISKNDVSAGYLAYTQRNVLNLAFKHLNAPYGWGGSGGEQDCSGYLGQIFKCFGIMLPETSTNKIRCGKVFDVKKSGTEKEKNKLILKNASPAISFLYFPGHIMLYIGTENNKPYIIHAIWGLTSYDSRNNKTLNYINRVIVSDLTIGEEVAGNSLIDRVSKLNIIK